MPMEVALRIDEKGEIELRALGRPIGPNEPDIIGPPLVQFLSARQFPSRSSQRIEQTLLVSGHEAIVQMPRPSR